MEEYRRILKERPDLVELLRVYLTLNDQQQKGVLLFLEQTGQGAEDLEAATRSAAYLTEHGETRFAELLLQHYS